MITTIRVKYSTKDLLDKIGSKGDTYDSIVSKLAKKHLGVVE